MDTPGTQAAVTRFKRMAKTLGKGTFGMLRDIAVDVGSEAVKKALLGP